MGLAMTDAEVQQKTDDCEAACELEGADVTQCADAFESSGSSSYDDYEYEDEEVTDCAEIREWITDVAGPGDADFDAFVSINGTEEAAWDWIEKTCTEVCNAEGKSDCSEIVPIFEPVNEACVEAEKALADSTSDLEKIALRETCKLACTGEDAECGFLVNGLSFVLLAILAIFKY